MYVCLCNRYRDRDIREAVVAAGIRCARQAYLALGKPPRCGQCVPFAQALIDEAHREAGAQPFALASGGD